MKRLLYTILSLWLGLWAITSPLAAQDGTESLQPITDQNAAALVRLDAIGRGRVENMGWSPDGRWLAIQTPVGIWLADSESVDAEPVLLQVLDSPQAFAFSADSTFIAIAGCQGAVPEMFLSWKSPCAVNETHLWNLNTLQAGSSPVRTIPNGQTSILKLTFSPAPFWNAPLIAALNDENVIQLSSGGRSWVMAFDVVDDFAFSPDGSQLLVSDRNSHRSSSDHVFNLLDVETYATLGIIQDFPRFNIPIGLDLLRPAFFSEDGQHISGTVAGGIWSWDVAHPDAEPVFDQRIPIPEGTDTDVIQNTTSDLRRALSLRDSEKRLWLDAAFMFSPAPPEASYVVIPREESFYGFSPHDGYLIMGQREEAFSGSDGIFTGEVVPGSIRLYDTTSGSLAFTLTPAAMPYRTAFSADETKIAYMDAEHQVHLFNLDAAREIAVIGGFAAETYGVAVHPDGSLIYSSCAVQVATASSSSCMPLTLYVGEKSFSGTAFFTQAVSPDGRLLVNRRLVFRDSSTGEVTREIKTTNYRIWHLDFSPDGNWLAVSGETPYLLPLDEPEREPIVLSIPMNESASIPWTPGVTYSPDGRLVATVSFDGMARLWDAASGELLAVLHSETSPRNEGAPSGDGIAFSPDGTLLAFGACYLGDASAASSCFHGRVYVYEVSTALARGELQPADARLVLSGAEDYTVSVIFSPDGSLIVGSSSPAGGESEAGHEVTVWSARTGELLTVLQAPGATELAFSPDGRQLYSNSVDGVVYRWGVRE